MFDSFINNFNSLWHLLIGYAVPFLFVLTIVVFFHELGHFLVGRWAGVRVLTFSLGFGPELFGFDDRHGTPTDLKHGLWFCLEPDREE